MDIFFSAIEQKNFECFLSEDTCLPMMYLEDAVNATVQIMQVNANQINIRTSYNLSAMNFTPKELASAIHQYLPNFTISYKPDYRQAIADSWPDSIDDTKAREDWGWSPNYTLSKMTKDILENLQAQ